MKRVNTLKSLFVAIALLFIGNGFVVLGQSSEKHLDCLKKVYSSDEGEVLLDCKPEDSKYVPCEKFYWKVKLVKRDNRVGDEIKGTITKRNGKYYLIPQKLYNEVGEKEVYIEYSQYSGDGRGYSTQYKIKVVE